MTFHFAQFEYLSRILPYSHIFKHVIMQFHNISCFRSNRIKTIRLPLFVGLCMMFIGNALYICLELGLPIQRRYLLLLGRFITGMGSGNVSLLRTYASTASTSKDRPRAIAFVTCGQALVGFLKSLISRFYTNLASGHD